MKNIAKTILAITFSLALIMPVAANVNTQDDKKAQTEKVKECKDKKDKKECKETKKCCDKKAEKKGCEESKKCSGNK